MSANFTTNGTARLTLAGGYAYLAALDATFALPSGIGTVTGTITAGPATKGQGTCYPDTGAAELEIRGAVYTAQLPDGTADSGVADILVSTMPGAAPFSIAFDSTRSPRSTRTATVSGTATTTARRSRTQISAMSTSTTSETSATPTTTGPR